MKWKPSPERKEQYQRTCAEADTTLAPDKIATASAAPETSAATGAPARSLVERLWGYRSSAISIVAGAAIAGHLLLRYAAHSGGTISNWPLLIALWVGGGLLVAELGARVVRLEFGSDLLAGVSIVASVLLREYLAGTIIVLMLSGGQALETFALRSASSVLAALARRMPTKAHRRAGDVIDNVEVGDIAVGDTVVIYPHELCPVDGDVEDGDGVMDESYLTGEPFLIRKTRGSHVISGAINGDSVLVVHATQRAVDSRYAKIMSVMAESEADRPQLRRIGDRLGAIYTPIALVVAGGAWAATHDPVRFLAVVVIATPCPLLIAIPVAIIGAIGTCARRSIIVRQSVALERIGSCTTAIFDKTGTLTYGEPTMTEIVTGDGFAPDDVLSIAASIESYSKHPLATAVIRAAERAGLALHSASEVSERPGKGLTGVVEGRPVEVTSRQKALQRSIGAVAGVPQKGGLECVVLVDGRYAATLRFHDAPRADSTSFVSHLGPRHQFRRVMILSGDRASEVAYLAKEVGIETVLAEQSPEQKLAVVRRETGQAPTLYVGDGINDAPAMVAATVGVALGHDSDVTASAAGVVIMDSSLRRVDEFMHISRRMLGIVLQSAVGGMALSGVGMALAAAGHLTPVVGAVAQEVLDAAAVLNALRAALPPRVIADVD